MTDADKPAFVAALAELKALKPGPAITDLQFAAWWNAMRSTWSLADFRAACARLQIDHEFMPNPYHFEQLRRAARAQPGEAWARALGVARSLEVRGGQFQETQTGDAVLDAAARSVGGYRAIAMATTESLQFVERRFCEHYESIADAEATRAALPQVTGAPRHALPTGPRKLLGGRR